MDFIGEGGDNVGGVGAYKGGNRLTYAFSLHHLFHYYTHTVRSKVNNLAGLILEC